jgi:hypothetical protein
MFVGKATSITIEWSTERCTSGEAMTLTIIALNILTLIKATKYKEYKIQSIKIVLLME